MGVPYLRTPEWQVEAARLRAIQHKLFPRFGRMAVKMERKPVPVREDKPLNALVAGEIPVAEDVRRRWGQ